MTSTNKREKRCPQCGLTKSITEFYCNKNRCDGLSGWCKKCKLEKGKKWNKAWKQRNAEYVRERNKRYRHANRERVLGWRRKYREKHREEIVEKAYSYLHKRRAVRNNSEGNFTRQEWENLKKKQGYQCLACEKKEPKITLCRDHIIPLCKGGTNYIDNVQGLCKSCNSAKGIEIMSIKQLRDKIKVE